MRKLMWFSIGFTIAAILFNRIIPGEALANVLNTVIMTILILIFGEILPKTYAKTNPERFALRFSGLLYAIMKVLYPIVVCFMGLQKLVSRKKGEQVTMTEEELESIIDTMVQEGEIDECTWNTYEETLNKLEFDNIKEVFEKAYNYIKNI